MQEKLGMNDLPPDKPNEEIPKRNFKEKFHAFYNFFTVEPFLLCFILPNILTVLAMQQFNMEKACQADLNYTAEICTKAVSGDADDNTTIEALDSAQVMVADMTAWKSSLQSGLPAVATLFVGAWSDKTGNRKALMLIPLAGEIISAFGMLLTTYYFKEWPLWVTGLIEGLPPALAGGLSIALMGAYSYIADVTTEESRTFRVGVVAVIVTLGIPIATSISGIIIEAIGYYGVFGVNLGLYIFGFIFTYFRVHDVRRTDKSKESVMQQILQFFNPLNVWETLSLLILKRGKILAQIILILCVHTVTVGPAFGEGAVLYLYCLKKFSMDVVEYSFLSTYQIVVGLVGTAVAVTLFCKLLKLHDAIVGIIATASRVLSYFVYAFAPTKPWFYSGTAFGFFGNTGVTAIRSLGTKIVKMDEVGRMCSLISLVEAIVPVVYTPLFSKVYSNTLDTFPGTFYVVAGAMTIPAFFIFIALYIFYKRAQRDIVKNPAEKEMYAHENDVTAL